MSPKQKLGLVTVALASDNEDEFNYLLELIKNHALGAVWVLPENANARNKIERIKAAADYPILIFSDAESGIGEHLIGRHNAVGLADNEELAYIFGKVTAVTARNMGYNVICNPLLDMVDQNAVCGGNSRSLGSNKYWVTALASAITRGMHDGGVLTVAKHYPGSTANEATIDPHMAESSSDMTREELLEYNLYPYLKLNEAGLLDGIMSKHSRFHNIDPVYPATLSKELLGIIRDEGFDGFFITDAMGMMGVVSRFGEVHSLGLSIEGGNDLSLAFRRDHKSAYEAMCTCYDEGIITDARLDEAVKKVLKAQHKTLSTPKFNSLTEEDIKAFEQINTDSIYALTDEGVSHAISRDGRHYFAIMTNKVMNLEQREQLDLDTFTSDFHNALAIADKIAETFPNSGIGTVSQFPFPHENMNILRGQLEYDDVVLVTYFVGRSAIARSALLLAFWHWQMRCRLTKGFLQWYIWVIRLFWKSFHMYRGF